METEPDSNRRVNKETQPRPHHLTAGGKFSVEHFLLSLFMFLVVTTIIFGYINYRNYVKHFRKDTESQLSAIALLKSEEISGYIEERLGDGAMLFRRRAFYDAVRLFFENPEDANNARYLREWMDRYVKHYQYVGISIMDTRGVVRMSIPDTGDVFCCSATIKRLPEILRANRVQLGDFCRSDHDDRIYLSILVPILDEEKNNPALGVISLRIDPETYLYPYIQRWPIPSETAETLLVRRDGDDALFLNELKFQNNTALNLRFPIDSNKGLPAVKAVLGQTGIVEGRDYRGVPVLAYVRAIAETPWLLVARIDKSEAYGPMRKQLLTTITLVIAVIISAGAVTWFIWRRQSLVFYQMQYLSAVALKASEERYRRLFEAAKDGVLLIDFDTGLILDVNPFLIELLRYSKSEFLQKYLWDIGAFKNIVASKDSFMELRDRGYVRYESQPLETKDGKPAEVEFISNVYLVDGRKTIQCNIRDISEHRRLERELAQAREVQFRTLIENLPQKVFLKDRNSAFISCNENYAKDLKIKSEEVAGKTDYDFFPTYLAEKYREDDKRVMESGKTENLEEEYLVMKDFLRGAQKSVINTVKVPVRDKAGNITGIFGLFWDITDRKRADDEVRNLNRQIEFVLGATKTGLDIIDSDYNMVYIDPEWRKIYGNPAGKKCYEYFMVRHEECPGCGVRKALETKQTVVTEEILVREGNRSIQVVSIPFQDKDGNWLVAEVNTDITERKLAEAQRAVSEEKFKTIFDGATDGIVVVEIETKKFIMSNKSFCAMTGYSSEEVKNIGVADIHPEKDLPIIMDRFEKQAKRELELARELPVKRKDGTIFYADINSSPILMSGKQCLAGFFRDVTERKEMDEKMRLADKIKSATEIKSKFTSMVSHELRSPMAVIKESLNLVLEGLVGNVTDEQKDVLDTAKNNVDRLSRLINNVLDFQKMEAGKMELNLAECDINKVVLDAGKEINILAEEKGLSFTVNIDESMPAIRFDKDKIAQVLTNLLSNAIRFTEKGGISVSTRRENNVAHVMVEDTGLGIQGDDITKLFQIFEQLGGGVGKKRGGTGLGLAISKEIIQMHNGKIWVESKFGAGSTFHFTLPIKELRG